MLKCHDMTSWHDVKVWRHGMKWHHHQWSTFQYILNFIFFLKRTNLDYKNPKTDSSQAVTSWHFHDVTSWRPKHWLFHHSTISGSRRDRAKIFFLFLRFFGWKKSMACRPNTWPWRVTLYVKVTWPFKWPFLSRDLYMLETWFCFCFHGLLGQESQWHVSQIRDLDAWPCTSRSRDLTSDLSYLGPYTC